MRNALVMAALSAPLCLALSTVPAFAAERSAGKHSQDDVRNACNSAGGTLLGVSDLGSYGCEVESTGNMILCNKNSDCTYYTAARTAPQIRRLEANLHLKRAAVMR
jgi:hypothetical protein